MKNLSKIASLVLSAALAFGFASCKTNTDDEPVTYKVTYSTEYGTAPDAITVNENTVLTEEQLPALSAEGQTFTGWYDGDTKAVSGTYKVTKNVTLTAKWNVVTYTVTFNTKGGSTVESQTIIHGNKATKPVAPTKESTEAETYAFENWYTSEDNGATLSDTAFNFDTAITKDITLYAKWLVGFVKVAGSTVNTAVEGSSVFIEGRSVTIPTLFVCNHEVTQAEYEAVMGSNPSYFDGTTGKEAAEGETQANRPVEKVSWYDALVYCNKKSIAENLTPCYTINGKTNPSEWGDVPTTSNETWNAVTCNFSANGYRLPTEAEWEYVARGGSALSANKYSGTNSDEELANYAWYSTNSDDKTHEVKKKTANSLGIYDMTGNVWEWCWDWYSSSIAAETPAAGASSGSDRVRRGGSYSSSAGAVNFSVAGRVGGFPKFRLKFLGFRVVRTAE